MVLGNCLISTPQVRHLVLIKDVFVSESNRTFRNFNLFMDWRCKS